MYLLFYNNEFLTDQYTSFKVLVDIKSVKMQNTARKYRIRKKDTYRLILVKYTRYCKIMFVQEMF